MTLDTKGAINDNPIRVQERSADFVRDLRSRCRRHADGKKSSAEIQLEQTREYAKSQGWSVYKGYVDLGAGGMSNKGRPQFNAMLGEALRPDPPFTVILVCDYSRFYRHQARLAMMQTDLHLHGVRVEAAIGPKEDDTITSSIANLIRATIDDHEKWMRALKGVVGVH